MKLEFYPAGKLKKEILEIVGKYLDLKKYKVFFFGSRVKGLKATIFRELILILGFWGQSLFQLK